MALLGGYGSMLGQGGAMLSKMVDKDEEKMLKVK